MYAAMAQGAAPSGEFAFKLDQNGSELFIGGTNPALYTGDIEFHNVTSKLSGFWQIGGGSVSVGGKAVASDFEAVIDSGSTIISAPPAAAKAFWDAVEGAQVFDADQGLWAVPCAAVPEVAFSWGGKTWTISADEYVQFRECRAASYREVANLWYSFNAGLTDVGSTLCVGGLAGADLGLGESTWLLGDT